MSFFQLLLVQKYVIMCRMKRKVAKPLIVKWAQSVGGFGRAAKMLMEATEVAASTADKLVRGVYPYEPQFLLRKTLCEMSGFSEDELFPLVAAKGKAS